MDFDPENFQEALNRFRDAEQFDRENRDLAINDLEFLIGDQWDREMLLERNNEKRITMTINRLPQFVRQVTSDLMQLNPSIVLRPVDNESDKDLAAIMQSIVKQIERNSCADFVYTQAAMNAARCGMGNFRITTEYADDDAFEQTIKLEAIADPFAVYWDPEARHPTRKDAMFCYVVSSITKEEFQKKYPEESLSQFPDYQYQSQQAWFEGGKIRLAEYWVKIPIKKKIALLEDGQTIDLSELSKDAVEVLRQSGTIKVERKVESHKVVQYIMNGNKFISETQWASKYIPIVFVGGEEITLGDRIIRKSVIRDAKDAQVLYNYSRSAEAEYLSLAPKAPFLATQKQIEGFERIWKNANKRNYPYLPYNPDDKAPPPQRQMPPQASSAIAQSVLTSSEDMKATTGIYDAALGMSTGQEVSGKAILARKAESDTVTIFYTEALKMAIEQSARIILDLIPKIYDTPRMVRVFGKKGEVDKVVMINNGKFDLSNVKYDIEIEMGADTTTARAEARDVLMQFMMAMPQSATAIADLLVGMFDWKEVDEIAKRLNRMVPQELKMTDEELLQAQQQPQEPDPLVMAQVEALQAQAAKIQAEIDKISSEVTKNNATSLETMTKAQLNSADIAEKGAKMQIEEMLRSLTPEAIEMLQMAFSQSPQRGNFSA